MSTWSYPSDDTDFYAANAQAYHAPRSTGVYSSDVDFVVTATSAMNVEVSIGIAWMLYERLTGASFVNDATAPLTVSMADGYRPRIDRVVGRKNFVTNTSDIYIKQGTPATNPIAPIMQRNAEAFEICFADIRIPAGTIQLTQGMINNAIKLDESVCGVVRDAVERIPTQQLYDAWWSWFSSLKLDAEEKAAVFADWMVAFRQQNEDALAAWILDFKNRHEQHANDWYDGFTSANTTRVADWYNLFTTQTETEVLDWFQTLRDELDENQAVNLANMIYRHENTILNTAPVHGLRLRNGNLQVDIGIGWATLATVPVGYTAGHFDALDFTAAAFDAVDYTAEQFDTQIEVEA